MSNNGSTSLRSNAKYVGQIALLAICYFLSAKAGLSLAFIQDHVTVIWPPTGIAIACLLIYGLRLWPGVAIGAFLVNLSLNGPAWVSVSIALGNTLEALIAFYLLSRVAGFRDTLERLKDVTVFLFSAGVLATIISAAVGTISLGLSGLMPWAEFERVFATWWMGDAMGVLIVSPFLFSWAPRPARARLIKNNLFELGIILLATLTAGYVLMMHIKAYPYFVFPFLAWAAIRTGLAGSTLVTLLFSGAAVYFTAHGTGPFIVGTDYESMINLVVFLIIFSSTGLILSSLTSERLSATRSITLLRKEKETSELNEDRERSLFELSQMNDSTEDEVRSFALEVVVRLTKSKAGYLHYVNEDEGSIELVQWSKDVLKTCTSQKAPHYPIANAGIWADCIRLRTPVVHNDYVSETNKKGLPEDHIPVYRHMGVPVFDGGKIVAVAGVGNKEQPYDDQDVQQFSLFMNNMWLVVKQKRVEETLKKHSTEDTLTGLANRRHFDRVIENEWLRSIRESKPLSVVMVDIDYFKAYNDTYGHQKGDRCLKIIGECLKERTRRPSDMVARYGGEEFVAILPNTDSSGSFQVAESMRKSVLELNLDNTGSEGFGKVTISAGVATMVPYPGTEPTMLVERADRALYVAKNDGRNRISIDTHSLDRAATDIPFQRS